MRRAVIDVHLHLDDRIPGPAINAANQLNTQLDDCGISRGVVLHLQWQRWTVEEVAEAICSCNRLAAFVNINPCEENARDQLTNCVRNLGYIGLKLHPREQNYSILDERTQDLVLLAGELGIPVIIDTFPGGKFILCGFCPRDFALLAQSCPGTKIVMAHMGGHYVLDFVMLAKAIPNIFFDISFSLLYYKSDAVIENIICGLESLEYDRIFYGSDYPQWSVEEALTKTVGVFRQKAVNSREIEKILFHNAKGFFRWKDV